MLSAAQMAQLSRLLDEALELDLAGRRSWLAALAAEHRELEPALRRALLPRGLTDLLLSRWAWNAGADSSRDCAQRQVSVSELVVRNRGSQATVPAQR